MNAMFKALRIWKAHANICKARSSANLSECSAVLVSARQRCSSQYFQVTVFSNTLLGPFANSILTNRQVG